MPTDNLRIISYMVPIEYDDGKGFRTHVSPEPGCWLLISEIDRRPVTGMRLDETLVFPAGQDGEILSYTEMYNAADTPDALQRIKDCWDVEEYNRRIGH